MVVYMDIVDFLCLRFFFMENVVDIFKFCGGIFGCYVFVRVVGMNYQVYELSMFDWILQDIIFFVSNFVGYFCIEKEFILKIFFCS